MKNKNLNKLNRKVAPPIFEVTALTLPTPSVFTLDNGIKIYETRLGTQEIMKLDIVFLSGRAHEHKRLVSRATARQLREGTTQYSAAVLAEKIDFYAGTLQTPVSLDSVGLVLYCMTKHFEALLPLVSQMLTAPAFNEKELHTFAQNNIQALQVDLAKSDVVAYRKITEMMYGENHPYGYNSTPDDYRALSPDDLFKHHAAHFTADNCLIFLSGKIDEKIRTLLNQHLGQIKNNPTPVAKMPIQMLDIAPQKVKLPHTEDASQSAIRLAKRFGTRQNPDYGGFFVLNTILGGYFGSRLMTNIREKKGYTYGIYSSLDVMLHDGYFYISSEVGNAFVQKTVTEIHHEMAVLQQDLVSDEELRMVKNYLLGNMLNAVDGPFAVSDVVKGIITEGSDLSRFDELIDTIKHVSPAQLRDLAQKYFTKESFFEVIVGGK